MALWLVYSEGRHLAWARTGCLQEGRLAQSVVADGRQCRSAKGTWMVQGCGRFVWNHKVTARGWIIRKWVFLVKALSAVCPRLSAALRATLLLVRGCPRHGMFLSYFVVRGCPRMDIERKIASILRPCCPRLSAATGESNILRKNSCPRTLRAFIGFWLFLARQSIATCAFSPRPCLSCSACFCLLPRRSNPAMADSRPITL